MQAGSVALSTLNRLTNALLEESRLILVPLSSIFESLNEVAAFPGFRIGPAPPSDETPRRFFPLIQPEKRSLPNNAELSRSWMLLQKPQSLLSTRLNAVETDESGSGNPKLVAQFGPHVVHLNEKNFDEFVKGSPLVAVLYHADWCKMCEFVKPVWRTVSEEIVNEKFPATLAAVDITANPDLAIRENISHLPAVKLYNAGSFLRNVPTPIAHKDLFEVLKNPMKTTKSKEAVTEVLSSASRVERLTSESLYPFLKKTSHALVLFHQKGDNQSAEALKQLKIASQSVEDKARMAMAEVCCDDNANICTQLGVFQEKIPHVRYFHYLMKKQLYYSGNFSSSSLLDFMRTSAHTASQGDGEGPKAPDPDSSRLWTQIPNQEHVILLNDATFDRAIEIQPQLLVMFYASWCRHCAVVKPIFAEAAAELSTLGFPKRLAACELVANSRISQMQNIEFVPSFRLFEQGKMVSEHQSLRTKEEMVNLILGRNKSKMK